MRVDVRKTGSAPYIGLVVIDADTGFQIGNVVACDDEEGWVIVHKYQQPEIKPIVDKVTDEFTLEKVYRPIRVVEKSSIPKEQRVGVIILRMWY